MVKNGKGLVLAKGTSQVALNNDIAKLTGNQIGAFTYDTIVLAS